MDHPVKTTRTGYVTEVHLTGLPVEMVLVEPPRFDRPDLPHNPQQCRDFTLEVGWN
jgi:hypothetical protein